MDNRLDFGIYKEVIVLNHLIFIWLYMITEMIMLIV